jgi:hypothetical protein
MNVSPNQSHVEPKGLLRILRVECIPFEIVAEDFPGEALSVNYLATSSLERHSPKAMRGVDALLKDLSIEVEEARAGQPDL